MATNKNITMRQFNGVDYDTLYPKTIASQVDDVYSKDETSNLFLPKAGGSMGGILDMNGNRITNLPTPTSNSDPTTKEYVDSAISGIFAGFTKVFDDKFLTTENVLDKKNMLINTNISKSFEMIIKLDDVKTDLSSGSSVNFVLHAGDVTSGSLTITGYISAGISVSGVSKHICVCAGNGGQYYTQFNYQNDNVTPSFIQNRIITAVSRNVNAYGHFEIWVKNLVTE